MTDTIPSPSEMLHKAIRRGDYNLVKELLEQGADPNEPDSNKNTPLVFAVTKSIKLVELLLEYKADVNLQNINRMAPISFCILGADHANDAAHNAILHLLIEKGADLAFKDYLGRTPLQFAETLCKRDAIKIIDKALRDRKEQAEAKAESDRIEAFHKQALAKHAWLYSHRRKASVRKPAP